MAGHRVYLTTSGVLAPTQEAAGKGFSQMELPYTKAELIEVINELIWRGEQRVRETTPEPEVFHHDHDTSHLSEGPVMDITETHQALPRSQQEAAVVALAAMEQPGVRVEAICDLIFGAPPVSLSRYARAVSMGYQRLGER